MIAIHNKRLRDLKPQLSVFTQIVAGKKAKQNKYRICCQKNQIRVKNVKESFALIDLCVNYENMASDIRIITNEAFLKTYDDLKLSIINQKRNTKNLTWDQIRQIFTQLKVEFCDVPNDKVSQIKCLTNIYYNPVKSEGAAGVLWVPLGIP